MFVLPPDSDPAISSPTSPAEEVWTCPGQGGRGASHSAWLPADSILQPQVHTHTHTHTHTEVHTCKQTHTQIRKGYKGILYVKDSYMLQHKPHCCHKNIFLFSFDTSVKMTRFQFIGIFVSFYKKILLMGEVSDKPPNSAIMADSEKINAAKSRLIKHVDSSHTFC